MTPMPAAGPGWYEDPGRPGFARFWDGSAWVDRWAGREKIGQPADGFVPCTDCGRLPTAPGEFVSCTGVVIVVSLRTVEGHFCKRCGVERAHAALAHSLLWGWWSVPSIVVNPILLAVTYRNLRAARALPDPIDDRGTPPVPVVPFEERAGARAGLVVTTLVLLAEIAAVLVALIA